MSKTGLLLGSAILLGVVGAVFFLAIISKGRSGHHGEEAATSGTGDTGTPEHLRPLMAEPGERPPFERLAPLQEADRSSLLRLYSETSDLSERRALVWALGHVGGKGVADVFIGALTAEFKDKALSQTEEDVLCDMIFALGRVAERDDGAYAFLKQGADPAFWKGKQLWRSPRGDYRDNLLVSYSIQAVAISGRPDAMSFLESLKARGRGYLHAFAGDITQGAFYLHLREKGGTDLLMRYMLAHNDKSLFEEWIQTAKGARWLEWANEQMRGPVPESPEQGHPSTPVPE